MNKRSGKILIVDDDRLLVEELMETLCYDGFQVDCLYDGNVVVNQITKIRYDCMIMDLKIPGKSGVEILDDVDPDQLGLKIIVMSGHPVLSEKINDESDESRILFNLLQRKTIGCLCKPFEVKSMLNLVYKAVES